MHRFILCLAVVAALAAAGCGSSSSSSAPGASACATASGHHKIKVAVKAAATYVSFKHFVLTPLRAGAFKKGAPHRVAALAKAGVALVADAALLRSVAGDVKDDKQLCHAYAPFTRATILIGTVGSKLKNGQGTERDLNGVTRAFSQVRSATS